MLQVIAAYLQPPCFLIIFHQYFPQNMGQQASCLRSNQEQNAFLQHEMRIYQWRADPRTNTHLPKVSFAPSEQAHKHRFAKFLLSSNQDFLRVDDLKQQADSTRADLLLFERYSGTLEEVQGILTPSEAAYVLTALVGGFSELVKQLQEVVVSRSCWFVTKYGQVCAWINNDPRCNFVDPSSQEQVFQAGQCKGLAFKLLIEVLKCCEESTSILGLFAFLRESIEKTKQQITSSELFETLRERISYYCGQNALQNCTSIESALRRRNQRPMSCSRTNVHASVATCKPQLAKPGLNQTRMTWDNERSFHSKARSLEVTHSQLMRTAPFSSHIQASPSSMFTNTSFQWQPRPAFSNIINPKQSITQSKIIKFSNIIEPRPQSQILALNKPNQSVSASRVFKHSESLQKTEKPKSIIKLSDSDVGRSRCTPVQLDASKHSSKGNAPTNSLKISLDNDPLISQNVLTEQDANLQLIDQKKPKMEHRASKFSKNSRNKPIGRKVSILEFEEEGRKDGRHALTCHQVVSSNLLGAEEVQMPWRTNKTITRLINDDTDSLVHSIGSSSDENIAGSLYSGVLTHMGRDVTRKDIPSSHSQVSSHSHSQSNSRSRQA